MVSVEGWKADGIEIVVVFASEAFAAFIVFPNPRLEPLFDFLLTFSCRFGFIGVDDRISVFISIINRGGFEVEGVLNEIEGAVSVGSPFVGVGDGNLGALAGADEPGADRRSMADFHLLAIEQCGGKS